MDLLATRNYDFTNLTSGSISFDYAYSQWIENNNDPATIRSDTMLVVASTDCGATFDRILYRKGGADLATTPPQNGALVITRFNIGIWVNETIDLSPLAGEPNVILAIANISGSGNNLYIDNINITSDDIQCDVSIDNQAFGSERCHPSCDEDLTLVVSNGTPPYSYSWPAAAGGQTTNPAEDVCSGYHLVTVTDAAGCETSRYARVLKGIDLGLEVTDTIVPDCGATNGGFTIRPLNAFRFRFEYIGFVPTSTTNGNGTITLSDLGAGTYEIRLTETFSACQKNIFCHFG